MKKILLTLLLGSGILAIQPAAAVEVGDIYYSDKTFSATYNSSKMPIGLVYWVYPSKDHGYIMQLNQPAAMTFANAKTHCANYTTLNTTIGTWRLPDFHETLLMAKESWNGVSNDKFNVLNKKLATITAIGEQLLTNTNYISNTTNSSGIYVNLSQGTFSERNAVSSGSTRFRCIVQF